MGRKIDRFIGETILASLVLFVCLHAYGNIYISAAIFFLICASLRGLRRQAPVKSRLTRSEAVRILRKWAYSEESVAMDEISGLFPGKDNLSECMYIIRPYEFSLSKSEIFSKWKSKSGNGQLTIISTCRADPPVRTYAETLRNPHIQIIDGDNLIRLIQRSGIAPPPRPALSERLKCAVRTLSFSFQHFSRKRCLLIGLVMFAMYMLLGSPYYLTLSIGLWFLVGISRRSRQT